MEPTGHSCLACRSSFTDVTRERRRRDDWSATLSATVKEPIGHDDVLSAVYYIVRHVRNDSIPRCDPAMHFIHDGPHHSET